MRIVWLTVRRNIDKYDWGGKGFQTVRDSH